jgi:molecular chaperone GrpE
MNTHNNTHADEPQQANAAPIENELVATLAACEKLRDEYLDGWKRAKADLVNYRKAEAERVEALLKFSNERLMQELITVLDSFDLGLAVLSPEDPATKGVHHIRTQLEDALKRHGLERIPFSPGSPFDPVRQEAVTEMTAREPAGTVVTEVERGYSLGGKVIRPTRVILSKGLENGS